ncbi:gag-pol, partial [Mucuna pruriens]
MSRRHEIPQHPILFCEVFDVWGIDFMGLFPISNGYSYILLVVDYMSRWVEAVATKTNDAKFGVPKALINNQGSHFCNRAMSSLLEKYGLVHRIATAYHPQTNGQAEVFNREIKKILQKLTNPGQKDWSHHLENVLWVHRTANWTFLGMSPYRIIFGKACHLPSRSATWPTAKLGKKGSSNYKSWRNSAWKLMRTPASTSNESNNSMTARFSERSSNSLPVSSVPGGIIITKVLPYSAVELQDKLPRSTFQANGQQHKIFHEGPTTTVGEVESISLTKPATAAGMP